VGAVLILQNRGWPMALITTLGQIQYAQRYAALRCANMDASQGFSNADVYDIGRIARIIS